MQERYLLAGDIGGTKTNLAIYSTQKGVYTPLHETRLENDRFHNFEEIVSDYLRDINFPIQAISLGIAGPVRDKRVEVTNLPWIIDASQLEETFSCKVSLLNDLEALAYAVPILQDSDLEALHAGKVVEQGAIAVVAPGTGLGEAFLTWDEDSNFYQAHPSEGGHTDFAPRTPLQIEMLVHLLTRIPRVGYEQVAAGVGLPNVYCFLRDTGKAEEPDWLAKAVKEADDPVPIIINTALNESKDVPLCTMTLEVFIEIIGAEAGNLALKVMSTGGIYLGGGIPPRIIDWLKRGSFIKALQDKDPHKELVAQMPVKVILNPKANLLGAAQYGLQQLANE
ncbi:MAG: glucokinase [Chloroflexi bacterium]|nr:MAG: glucokinase [Chloroflexota bacterium]MBL1196505.1 glucokinase [Chloroflexota bacterium]NOH13800.1 glucokinase [Chloroflexota bacterium]